MKWNGTECNRIHILTFHDFPHVNNDNIECSNRKHTHLRSTVNCFQGYDEILMWLIYTLTWAAYAHNIIVIFYVIQICRDTASRHYAKITILVQKKRENHKNKEVKKISRKVRREQSRSSMSFSILIWSSLPSFD